MAQSPNRFEGQSYFAVSSSLGFDPNIREVIEMLYLQETPVILDDSKLAAKLGGVKKTPYDEGIQKTVEWMRK